MTSTDFLSSFRIFWVSCSSSENFRMRVRDSYRKRSTFLARLPIF